mmetsp:Transcript_7938/g.11218  ORF Transcript_7938/g.11218 Transcript_7938/m.11218 type:complete len:349 (+) Transcript_7938:462-1508(+)
MSGVAFCLGTQGYDTSFLQSSVTIKRALRAFRRTPAESRVHNIEVKAPNERDPASMDIMREIRRTCWENRTWATRKDMDARGMWISVALGYDTGSRVSNLARPDGTNAEDHSLRTCDITFEIADHIRAPFMVRGGEALRLEIVSGHLDYSVAVTKASITLMSSKVVKSLKSQMVPKILARRSLAESQLLDDLIQWVLYSGTKDDDYLCTRYLGKELKGRSTTKKDISTALKRGAEALGLDPKKYSSKSLRGGFTTAAKGAAMPEEELLMRGGWAPGSKVPDVFYNTYSRNGRGGMAIAQDGRLEERNTGFGPRSSESSELIGKRLEPVDGILLTKELEESSSADEEDC